MLLGKGFDDVLLVCVLPVFRRYYRVCVQGVTRIHARHTCTFRSDGSHLNAGTWREIDG